MKGAVIFAAYVAIVAADAALAQSSVQQYQEPPRSMKLLNELAAQSAGKTAEIERQVAALGAAPIVPLPRPPAPTIVIKFGPGGRVDEHKERFSTYRRHKAKVEVRGPCYSACTLLLAYIEPDKLCIAEGAFMAFHAIRSMERGERMVTATRDYYDILPLVIRMWIDDNGGWENLPLDGYKTLHDRQMWARGYPQCK